MFEDIDIKAIKKELRNFSKNYIENFNKIEKFIKSEIDEILTLKKKNKLRNCEKNDLSDETASPGSCDIFKLEISLSRVFDF